MLFAVSEAANRLGFDQVSGLIAMFIQFGADILLGAVILVVGFWLADWLPKWYSVVNITAHVGWQT